ncbi:MAG: bifunctional UDP-sugar hydrolase/5'-nucleotidase [Halobacteriaceae archaeon]
MLRVLHYSDIEAAYDTPERVGRLAGLIEELRDGATLVLGTGDTTSPGVLSLATEGEQALDFFEAVDPDASTFGNHDFDYGLDRTLELVRASPQSWVSSNTFRAGDRFGADAGVVPTLSVEVDGQRIGLFGLLDDETPALNPAAADLTVTDPIEAGVEAAESLRADGADIVIALSHLGQGDEQLAVAADVDVILGGHVHSERIERIGEVVLTRPGVNGHVLLEVSVANGETTVTRHSVTEGPVDEELVAALEERQRTAGLDEVVATVDDPIERTQATVFRGESRIGNFVADAYRWAAGTDIALQNSGGIREGEPLEGDVTVADLIGVVPFEEPVTVAELTGQQLRKLFEGAHGDALAFGEPDWWHAHVSGAELVWDHASNALEEIRIGGEPLQPGASYTLATTDYLFYTSTEFTAIDGEDRVRKLDIQHEVLIDYAREEGIDPALEGRIRRRGIDAD